MSDLKDLEPLSKRLNAATDELNEALQAIQDRLNALSLGVEAWLDEYPNQELHHEVVNYSDDDAAPATHQLQELGYGRLGDSWALLVRTRTYSEPSGQWESPDLVETDRKPLLRTSRHIRVAAVSKIPALIEKLRERASVVIDAVEQAKRIAADLK